MKLLLLKHWQLFLITFAIPFVGYLISVVIFIAGMVNFDMSHRQSHYNPYNPPVPDFNLFVPLIIGGAIMLIGIIIHLAWMYNAGIRLQHYMHPEMRMLRVGRFKIFFLIPVVYFILMFSVFVPFITNTVNSNPAQGDIPNIGSFLALFFTMFIGHLFSMFCIIFCLYFTAKTVRSAELQREAHFSDYIGEFFLIWFYPVGIWFIQPKINKIINRGIKPEIYSTRIDNDF